MPKYYRLLRECSTLRQCTGANITIPIGFTDLGLAIIQSCTLIQNLIQKIIYVTHGSEIMKARRTLKEFPNPKARIDFLYSYPYSEEDPVVLSSFNFARLLFLDIYELRNVLSHEVWASSNEHPETILFSSLDEQARLLTASGRIWHVEDATSQETLDAILRFIHSVKLVNIADLISAKGDADLCLWILMQIQSILDEEDPDRKEEARQLFLRYKGTAHRFKGTIASTGSLEFNAIKSKTINR